MSDSEWQQNMTRSLEKWGPKTDRRLRMVAIPVNNGDVEDALAEHAALRAEVERLRKALEPFARIGEDATIRELAEMAKAAMPWAWRR